jgi:2-methylfumaryl-CoA hydratase
MNAETSKTNPGNFFEDFRMGDVLVHPTPRTITEGDRALYQSLYPTRFPVGSSAEFAAAIGLRPHPVEDLIGFHVAFGKTVPDVSLNAVANLGYADCRFLRPIVTGDTLRTTSEVIGLKENSNGKTGIVYVRSIAVDAAGEPVLTWARWVMVRKNNTEAPSPETVVPDLPSVVAAEDLPIPAGLNFGGYDRGLAGEPYGLGDYAIGEKIDHVDGVTITEAEHMMATRLWQNTAKVHFNVQARPDGRRLIYGGHVISLARALSFNGLANSAFVVAINAGSHVAPCFAGDTVYAWSEVLDKAEVAEGVGALRTRLVAVKDAQPTDFPLRDSEGKYVDGVLLDLDLWTLMPL